MYDHRFCPDDFISVGLVSPWLRDLAALGVIAVVGWRLWRPGGRLQTLLVAIAANLVATECIKTILKWAFGRWRGTGLATTVLH